MQESKYIWKNGKIEQWSESKTHILTHSLHYGTAVFEGIRAYKTKTGPAIFRLEDHINRLFESAKIIKMDLTKIDFSKEDLIIATKDLMKKNNLDSAYIRPIFYYGYGKMGLDTIGAKIDASISMWPWGAYLGEEGKIKGISLKVSNYTRHFAVKDLNQSKASGFYINSMLAKMDALENGFNEALMLDLNGNVAECSGENIFMIKDNVLFTPSKENCLNGITRQSVIKIATDLGYSTIEKVITLEELLQADEIFLTGTAAEITPVSKIDNKIFEVKEISKKIINKYDQIIHGEDENYFNWLSFIE
jgi:branched-chain amino acid aminotransferase